MSYQILFLGSLSGTCLDRANAYRRLGHSVLHIDPRRLLPDSIWVDRFTWRIGGGVFTRYISKKLRPLLNGHSFDICHVENGEWISHQVIETLHQYAPIVLNYNIDDPFNPRDGRRFQVYRDTVSFYDLLVVVREENVAEAYARGAKKVLRVYRSADEVSHSPQVLDAKDHAQWDSDVMFLGTWMPERGPFLLKLTELGVPLTIRGANWHKSAEWKKLKPFYKGGEISGNEYAKAIQCAKVNLGLLSKGNRDLHTTRSLEIPAIGGLLCAERTSEHQKMYLDGKEVLMWSTAEECAQLCKQVLNDSIDGEKIAQAGHQRYIANQLSNERIMQQILNAAFER